MTDKQASSKALARIRFEPDGIEIYVRPNTSVSAAALMAGSPIEMTCGGMGTCGKCRVIAHGSLSPPDPSELRLLRPEELAQGVRLACRARVLGDVCITVPASSRSMLQKILSASEMREVQLDPAIRKVHLRLDEPSLADERAEFERLADALAPLGIRVHADLSLIRELSAAMRAARYDLTAVLDGNVLIGVESGDTTERCFGIAFDLGSTTVVGYLMDLNSGRDVAVASAMNPQMAYGDDLVSRIRFAMIEPNGRELLRKAAYDVMNRLIRELTTTAGISPLNIYEATVVGNTCMTHLFLGIDPSSLGLSPYVPAICASVEEPAHKLNLKILPHARVHILPNVAGFVGSDLVGVLLAGLWEDDGRTRLAVDIGTNGEMALRHKGRTYACSAAAGPAFEGARISCGMRGGPGAIDSVEIRNGELRITTIDNLPAAGLCGSGLIDAVAELLDAGLLDESGRLVDPDWASHAPLTHPVEDSQPFFFSDSEAAPSLPRTVAERLVEIDGERAFILATADEAARREPVILLQRDIRQLQLAKGSIRAAIETLLKVAGAREEDLDEILLAGAFGNYIRRESAVRIGLVPPLPLEKINPIGNAAGAGARLALISRRERERAERIARDVLHIELANHPDYQNEFMDRMFFPAADGCRS